MRACTHGAVASLEAQCSRGAVWQREGHPWLCVFAHAAVTASRPVQARLALGGQHDALPLRGQTVRLPCWQRCLPPSQAVLTLAGSIEPGHQTRVELDHPQPPCAGRVRLAACYCTNSGPGQVRLGGCRTEHLAPPARQRSGGGPCHLLCSHWPTIAISNLKKPIPSIITVVAVLLDHVASTVDVQHVPPRRAHVPIHNHVVRRPGQKRGVHFGARRGRGAESAVGVVVADYVGR